MKRLTAALLILILLCACGKDNTLESFSKDCGINLSWGDVVSAEDTHGGFHGDGLGYMRVHYTDGSVTGEMAENEHWNALPLPDKFSPFEFVPTEIENGYYWFYDRNSEASTPYDDSELLDRCSYNFTLAIYDSDNNDLYLYIYDT